jgi:hypothetical protein
MKLTSLFCLFLVMLTFASCGGKSGGGSGSGVFTSALTTQEGYYDLRTMYLEVGGQSIPPSTQYQQVMMQAIQQAQYSNVQPVMINGSSKYRARVTAQLSNGYNNYNTGYNNYNPGYVNAGYNQTAGTLNITSVLFY